MSSTYYADILFAVTGNSAAAYRYYIASVGWLAAKKSFKEIFYAGKYLPGLPEALSEICLLIRGNAANFKAKLVPYVKCSVLMICLRHYYCSLDVKNAAGTIH